MKSFSEMVKELQEKYKGYLVLVRNGIFYCAIGKDAVIMHQLLGYKPVCFKDGVCKCGIPVNAVELAILRLIETGYSCIIFNYKKAEKTYNEVFRLEGREVFESNNNIGCEVCWYKKEK